MPEAQATSSWTQPADRLDGTVSLVQPQSNRVRRIASGELTGRAKVLFRAADAIVLDTKVHGALGDGRYLNDWHAVTALIEPFRDQARGVIDSW